MNVVGEWGRVFARALVDAGVRDVVVSPGSRSTPYVLAVDAEPRLAVHLVIDERSAGFFALGRARATGRPSALLCTSGTAAANYAPAVVEADAAGIPLLVLTADRPLSLMECGANQTIEQLALFRGRTRFQLDVGLPSPDARDMRALRRALVRAVTESIGPRPGPTHLNLRAEKPLEPGPADGAVDARAERAAAELLAEPVTQPLPTRTAPTDEALDRLAHTLAEAERAVVVAGPALPGAGATSEALFALCRRAGLPLLAEPTSQHRFRGRARGGLTTFDFFDLAWRSEAGRRALAPDLLIQVGDYPISKGYAALIDGEDGPARVVLTDRSWPDPRGDATLLCRADLSLLFEGLSARPLDGARDEGFVSRIASADRRLGHLVEEVIGASPFGEAAVARVVASSVPDGGALVVGNSLPVRELDLVCPGRLGDFPVVSQRGVSGIDGVVSGATGFAHASGRPTLLYVGDVSFLHDIGGLATTRALSTPLVVVVSNNDGGRIFEQLPVASAGLSSEAVELFTTPHGLGFEHAARLFGNRYARVRDGAALSEAIARGMQSAGTTIVEAQVPPSSAAAELNALRSGAEGVVGELSS